MLRDGTLSRHFLSGTNFIVLLFSHDLVYRIYKVSITLEFTSNIYLPYTYEYIDFIC